MNIGIVLALIATTLLVAALPRIRATTLISPWCWLVTAIWAIAIAHLIPNEGLSATDRHWYEAIQYSAHSLIFCPFMSLLGARRPQNRMWEMVVITLWFILVLPALEAVIVRPGQNYDTQGIRAWFMMILIFVSSMNLILGRFWICGILIGCAQFALVNSHLPSWLQIQSTAMVPWGLGFAIAALIAMFALRKPDRSKMRVENQVWLDYRDMFGGMWALRIRERINVTAKMNDWDLRLEWHGFTAADGTPLPDTLPADTQRILHLNFWNLMRKFVNQSWIDQRLES